LTFWGFDQFLFLARGKTAFASARCGRIEPMRALALAAVVCLGTALPVVAEEFRRITEQSEFIRLVADRDLTRLGIRLEVSPEGGIGGSAFGTGVTGA